MIETYISNSDTPNFLKQAFSRVKSRFHKEADDLKQEIENAPEANEVADVAFTDFKNKLSQKKTTDNNGREQQFYSAQLLGTVDFFGETLLKPLLESKYSGEKNFLKTIVSKVKYERMFQSLINSGIPETEQRAFKADFDTYLDYVSTQLKTKEDLEALKNGNVQLTQTYEITVNEQLEHQVQTQVSTDRQTYIETQKKADPKWVESSLVVPSRIGVIPRSFPIQSKPFERSASGTTLCSGTAWKNAQNFGINLPRGDAYDAARKAPLSSSFQKTVGSVDQKKSLGTDFSSLSSTSNFADMYTTSNSAYGHRAIAFLNQKDHKWYVMDPYPKGMHKSTLPVTIEEYQKKTGRQILQANFYQSDYYVA